jgi:hypothetical protein
VLAVEWNSTVHVETSRFLNMIMVHHIQRKHPMTIDMFGWEKICVVSHVLRFNLTSIRKHLVSLLHLLLSCSSVLVDVYKLVYYVCLIVLISRSLSVVELFDMYSTELCERLLTRSTVTLASVSLVIHRCVELLFKLCNALCMRLFALREEV